MADNINVTPGTGATVAADDIQVDGSHAQGIVQFVKLVDGTLNGTGSIAADIGAKANALRVAPANDITDATYIGDIKFGESLPAGTNNIGDVDILSIIPGVGATNLGKARDSALGGTDTGVMALAIRDDTLATLTPADGDYVPLRVSSTGQLHVTGGGGGTQYNIDIALGANDTTTLAGVVRDDSLTTLTEADGDISVLRVSSTGALHVTGGGGGTEYTEDVATANPIVGTATVMERDDVIAALTPIEGDWAAMRCSAEGALWVQDFNSDAALALLGTIDTDTGAMVTDLAAIEALLITIDSDTNDIKTAVELLDNAVDGNYLNTNMNIAGTDVSANAGVLDAQTLRVTIATDDECNNFLGTIDVDTSAMVVDLAAIEVLQTTIAGDTTSIDGKITACDTGAVVLSSGTVTTVSTVTNLAQLGGTAITMDEGVHDAGCQRVTIATDDDGVAHLATIAGDTTAIETAIEIIDDWDAVHDSAASSDGPQLMAAYDATKPSAVADGDAVRVLADEYGRLLSGVEKTAWQEDYDSADASGEGEAVKASAASTILVVQSYIISADTEMWVKLQEEDSTALTGKFWLKAGGGVAITLPDKAPLVLGVDSDLEVITEGAGDVSVSATGYTIPG